MLIQKYHTIFQVHLARILAYRVRALIYTLSDALTIFLLPLVWLAAFGDKMSIQGFTKPELVTYYVVLGIVFVLATPHPEEHMNLDIKDGKVSKWLMRPFSYFRHYLVSDTIYRVVQFSILIFLVPLLLLFYRDYMIFIDVGSLLLAIAASVIGFFTFFQLSFSIGCAAFWFDDAHAVRNLYWFCILLFGGGLVPLEFLPRIGQVIASGLPFRYLHYFPVKLYLGQLTSAEIIQGFAMQLFWFCLGYLIYRLVWSRGTRRYSAVGN